MLKRAREEFEKFNYDEGMAWLRKAASDNDGEALCLLGMRYRHGVPRPLIERLTVECFDKAAKLGNGWGMAEYTIYCKKKDRVYWRNKAQESGNNYAKWLSNYGIFCDVKSEEELTYLKRAAFDDNNMYAQQELGRIYLTLDENKKAFECLLMAAVQGNYHAQDRIGLFFYEGITVQRDRFEAWKWFMRTVKQGFPNVGVVNDPELVAFVCAQNARRAILCVHTIHKYKKVLSLIPYDVLKIVLTLIWNTRHNTIWRFGEDTLFKEHDPSTYHFNE